jgi:hypothetical protein
VRLRSLLVNASELRARVDVSLTDAKGLDLQAPA